MEQFRLSLYFVLAGSIITGVSTGFFLEYSKKKLPSHNRLHSWLLNNAEKVVATIILVNLISGISLSNQVYMWENENAYHDLNQISMDLWREPQTIFILEPDLVHMIEGVLFSQFELLYAPLLVWEDLPVKLYTHLELSKYVQLLKIYDVHIFITRISTWNSTRQVFEETRYEIMKTAWDDGWVPKQQELWTKSWDKIWRELPGFQIMKYQQLLIVKL